MKKIVLCGMLGVCHVLSVLGMPTRAIDERASNQ